MTRPFVIAVAGGHFFPAARPRISPSLDKGLQARLNLGRRFI